MCAMDYLYFILPTWIVFTNVASWLKSKKWVCGTSAQNIYITFRIRAPPFQQRLNAFSTNTDTSQLKLTDTWSQKENELWWSPMGDSQAGRVSFLLAWALIRGWCYCAITYHTGPAPGASSSEPWPPTTSRLLQSRWIMSDFYFVPYPIFLCSQSRNSNLVFKSFITLIFIYLSLHSINIRQVFKNTC